MTYASLIAATRAGKPQPELRFTEQLVVRNKKGYPQPAVWFGYDDGTTLIYDGDRWGLAEDFVLVGLDGSALTDE